VEMGGGEVTLTLGPPEGTRIEFDAGVTGADLAAAAEHALDSRTAWTLGQGSEAAIAGRGERGVLWLVRVSGGRLPLVEELRAIERYEAGRRGEGGLAGIFAAVLSADRALAEGSPRVEGAPAFFAQLAEEREQGQGETWGASTLVAKVRECIDDVITGRGLCKPAAGPLDSARFWLMLGEQLWDPIVRQRLAPVHLGETTRRLLIMLAGAWMDLKPEGWVSVRGTNFRLRGSSRRLAWPQVMEWEAGEVGRSALKYLTGYQTSYAFDGILTGLLGIDGEKAASIPASVAASESRSLLEEAALNWTCDPSGSFRVDLPERTPLTRWGVTSLRAWIVPRQGLWVALEKNEQPGASLQWTVRPPHLRRWILHEQAIPAMHLTLSALWRDLKIGGREVILADDASRTGEAAETGNGLRLHGRIRWGSEDELKRILREAYPVEEHIRVLSRGKRASRRAYRLATSHGVVLRPGTTFVCRHERGKPDESAEGVPLKARGLARLILASRPAVERQ